MYGRFEGPREASLTAALSATKDSSCRDRAIGDIELRIPPARRLPDGAPAKLDEVEPVAIEGRAEFQREIVEQRSEEHTSELQSLMRISYAVFCLTKKTKKLY